MRIYCHQIEQSQLDHTLTVSGWVNSRRDHGGVIFIDLRDHTGLLQLVIDPDTPEAFAVAESLRNEAVIQITGRVRRRPQGTENTTIASGEVEVLVKQLTLINRSDALPFQLDEPELSEEVRLRYRYLDLRRSTMQQRLRQRAAINRFLRDYLDKQGFVEVETPILTKATPEGARDYLVPSRTHKGQFFALPQSPQLFKQLLMMGGMDRYYQIVRCFRDEDLRSDRQPEFTQLDIETSFMDETQIMPLMETMIQGLFKDILGVDLPASFPRMGYQEAMERYGSDKPDLRIDLELVEVSDLLKDTTFKVFAGAANDPAGRVAALRVPNGNQMTRKTIDEYTRFVGQYGAKGLAYIKVNDRSQGKAGLQSPIVKNLDEVALNHILDRCHAVNGDLVFFGADHHQVVNGALGALRCRIGQDLQLIKDSWQPLWVTDFPMFEYDDQNKRWQALHHPFTAPRLNDVAQLEQDPGQAVSRAYDLVLNGFEVGGGSVRIHQRAMQQGVLKLLGIDDQTAQQQFGFLLDALGYGCPPHAGIAFGLDRLCMLMTKAANIREVIAFPKTQSAACLLTNAPTSIADNQLRELHIRPLRNKE